MTIHLSLGPGPEFDRIRRIAAVLGARATSLGDDCARIPAGPGEVVASTDIAIEGVHFRRAWLSAEEIGWRAAAGALSDLAAAGALAVGALVALVVPADEPEETVESLMSGVGDAVAASGGAVLGGDLSRGPAIALCLTVLGRAARPMSRRGARPGDLLWVTGALGGARAALASWTRGNAPDGSSRGAFARPEPRIAAGVWLAAHGATAMLDLSDGLAGDSRHLAAASGVGIEVELARIPVHPGVPAEAAVTGEPAPAFAAQGGEDYELLVALPPTFSADGVRQFQAACGIPLTRIGSVVVESRVRFLLDGAELDLRGFDHFA
jgi:thiamine-monophosphate kinase